MAHKHVDWTAEKTPVKPTSVAPAALDPKSLMGNLARTSISPDKPSDTLLDLDEALARVPPITAIPYPYPQGDFLTDPAKIACNDQARMDFNGPFTCLVNYHNSNNGAEPGDRTLNAIARDEGVSFHYRGKDYLNTAPWTPDAP